MKHVIRLLVVCMLFCLSACQQKKETLFIEKDGKLYEVFDQVSFYYPETFTADVSSYSENTIRFVKNEELLSYTSYLDSIDNSVEEMAALYEGHLQQGGASDILYSAVKLDSGNKCYDFTGKYLATGIKFRYIVCFAQDTTYIYGYQAPMDAYEDNIDVIGKYLESLTVHYE